MNLYNLALKAFMVFVSEMDVHVLTLNFLFSDCYWELRGKVHCSCNRGSGRVLVICVSY